MRVVVITQVDGAGAAIAQVAGRHAFGAVFADEDGRGALAALTDAGIPAAQTECAVDDGLANVVGVENISFHTFLSGLHQGLLTHGRQFPALVRVEGRIEIGMCAGICACEIQWEL